MAAPAAEALECGDRHVRDGRLGNLAGFYVPGRDGSASTDRIGHWLLALTGVVLHAGLRIVLGRRRDRGEG